MLGYLYIKKKHSYWRDLGVPYIEPNLIFGNIDKGYGIDHSVVEFEKSLYKKFKGKGDFAGIYYYTEPVVFVLEPDFIKTILVKDFNYFSDRGIYYNEKKNPISAHLFAVDTDLWRNLRTKLSPTFSSGKMKFMFPTIVGVANELDKYLNNEIIENNLKPKEIELKDILARFTTDVIGTCAFGLDCNSLKDPDSEFRKVGRFFLIPGRSRKFTMLITAYRHIIKKLRLSFFRKYINDFFNNIVNSTIEYREKNNIERKDFMDLLIKLKNYGNLDSENVQEENKLTVGQIIAQCFVFFIAGFETSSSAMTYSIYEMAKNQKIQDRAREEVKRIYKKYDNQWTYEAILELKYIDQIIYETMRKYPPVPTLSRRVVKDYNVPGTNIVLKKNTFIVIPTYAIHSDPEYFPDPEVYDPDRFSDDMVKSRDPYVYLPFGAGPRNCIGLRFGMMQSRIGLATVLLNYKFTTNKNTMKNVKIEPNSFLFTSVGGIHLNVEKI